MTPSKVSGLSDIQAAIDQTFEGSCGSDRLDPRLRGGPCMTVTICEICGVETDFDGDGTCEDCAVRAGLEQLEVLAQAAEAGDRRGGIRFICRKCAIPCSLDDHTDNASDASPFLCPWAITGPAWEREGDV